MEDEQGVDPFMEEPTDAPLRPPGQVDAFSTDECDCPTPDDAQRSLPGPPAPSAPTAETWPEQCAKAIDYLQNGSPGAHEATVTGDAARYARWHGTQSFYANDEGARHCAMDMPHSAAWHYRKKPWVVPLRTDLSEAPFRLHPETRAAVKRLNPGLQMHPRQHGSFSICTDASAQGGRLGSAWGLCVLGRTDDGQLGMVGWLAGHTSQSYKDVNNANFNSTQAEAVALAWAALVAMQLPRQCAVTLVSDSDSARQIFEAREEHRDTTLRVAVATIAAARAYRLLDIQWTKGHNGNPWNELCDSLSEYYDQREVDPLPDYPRNLLVYTVLDVEPCS